MCGLFPCNCLRYAGFEAPIAKKASFPISLVALAVASAVLFTFSVIGLSGTPLLSSGGGIALLAVSLGVQTLILASLIFSCVSSCYSFYHSTKKQGHPPHHKVNLASDKDKSSSTQPMPPKS